MSLSASSSIVLSKIEREEMKVGKAEIHLHSIASHFASALYPVALLFLFLHALHGGELYSRVYFYLMVLATASVPLTYLTGILEWKQKYKGAMVPIFLKKIRLGIALFVLGTACTTWYWLDPDIIDQSSFLGLIFSLMNISLLLPLIYLGYLGGKLVFK